MYSLNLTDLKSTKSNSIALEEFTNNELDGLSSVLSKSTAKGILEVTTKDGVLARIRMQIDFMNRA